jgi:hypothetical protein
MQSPRFTIPLLALAPLLASCNADRSAQPIEITPQFITYGSVDTNNSYSNTGAFIVRSSTTGQIFPICTGTLISATAFLTASHCTVYFEQSLEPLGWAAFVSFDNPIPFGDLTSNKTKLIAVVDVITNPAYAARQDDSGDIALLILEDRDTRGITPATLPTKGLLDQLLAAGTLQTGQFTAVGYGVQNRVVGGGVPYFQDLNPIPRMYAFSSYNSLGPGYLRLSQNPAKGDGGTCYGDSGGPNFLLVNNVQTLVAATVTGDTACRSTNVVYRLDTTAARNFLGGYVALP